MRVCVCEGKAAAKPSKINNISKAEATAKAKAKAKSKAKATALLLMLLSLNPQFLGRVALG